MDPQANDKLPASGHQRTRNIDIGKEKGRIIRMKLANKKEKRRRRLKVLAESERIQNKKQRQIENAEKQGENPRCGNHSLGGKNLLKR